MVYIVFIEYHPGLYSSC